jgi:translocator protein
MQDLNARRLSSLVAWLAVSSVPGIVGAPFVDRERYRALRKPAWAPPPAVFGPVWTTLYVLIGTSAWLARGRSRQAPADLRPFAIQLVLNALWTPLFFGLRRPLIALVDIVALQATIAWTIVSFARVRLTAGLLLVPYLAWTAFATALNGAIWWRNRGSRGRR